MPDGLAAALELSVSTTLNSCDSGYEPGAGEEDAQEPQLDPQTIYINGLAQESAWEVGADTGEGAGGVDFAQAVLPAPTVAAPTPEAPAGPAAAAQQREDLEATLARGMDSREQAQQDELEVTLGRGMHSGAQAEEQQDLEATLGHGMSRRTQSLPSSQPSLAFSSYLDQVAAEFEMESSDAEDMLGHIDM
jgi:hypothetical protein